jgi:hypothetical protein
MSSESERRTRAEFDRQYEAGIQAALKRCRGLAEQIESELCNKRLDFDSALSLADFQVGSLSKPIPNSRTVIRRKCAKARAQPTGGFRP